MGWSDTSCGSYSIVTNSASNLTPAGPFNYMGCYNCADSTVSYIIHSVEFKYGDNDLLYNPFNYNITNSKSSLTIIDYINVICGDAIIDSGETWDDGNSNSGDGWSNSCQIETGYLCSRGSPTTADVWNTDWGDGLKVGLESCDDGDTVGGDGWSAGWTVEPGWSCSGGSSSSADSCIEVWGDGKKFNTVSTYCDDGDIVGGDGCSNSCTVEIGYQWLGGTTSTPDTCSEIWGDGRRFNALSTYCDDGNIVDGDGCSTSWTIEMGWTWSGGTTSVADVCIEICGDGKRFNTNTAYWDDGNNINGDGWNNSCAVEIGYQWSGGTTATPDNCSEICGDGKRFNLDTSYCDDGDTTSGDGWSNSWAVEIGWTWSGGTNSVPDSWIEIWGDGRRFNSLSTYCDDGNLIDGDGWSSTWTIETGYSCVGGSSTTADVWTVVWGDGILITPTEAWDDGNTVLNDGCSNIWQFESAYNWVNNLSNNPATTWTEIWGDGIRLSSTGCDDGNILNGDGWSSTWTIELGYQCSGGSPISPDICQIVCGDGRSTSFDPTMCDDGNTISGDGCSSTWTVEPGYQWTTSSLTIPHTCTEICGDGRRIGGGWDDGNNINGDGCSSMCTIELGFTCSGGSATKKDTWVETWGDGKNLGGNEWDDNNTNDGDGWSSLWEIETCKAWSGGTSSSPDTCFDLVISASIGELINNEMVVITFSDPMKPATFDINDLSISITSDIVVKFTWTASYSDLTTLTIRLQIDTALQGGENLKIKLINSKKFRTPIGGCVQPSIFSLTMSSSLTAVAASAQAASGYTQYIIMGGVFLIFAVLLVWGTSLELIWSLVNTLQMISYLPFMVTYYPEHVKVMFEILGFANMDIEIFSDFFKKIIFIDGLEVPSYNQRFFENGIDNPLFLSNWASILFSLGMSVFTLLACLTVYMLVRCEKAKLKLASIINSYFFNNFLRFFTEGYLEIFFGALLNVWALTTSSIAETISFSISMISLLIWILFPFMTWILIFDKRNAIKAGNKKYLRRFGTMYADFRTNDLLWVQYYPIFLFRRLIFAGFLILLINHSEVQVNAFIGFSCMVSSIFKIQVFFYQVLSKPFNHRVANFLCSVNEGCLTAIAVIQIIFITDINSISVVINTGWMMISLMVWMVLINFSVIFAYTIYIKVKKICNKKVNQNANITNSDLHSAVRLNNSQIGSSVMQIHSSKKAMQVQF
jgi:cysteine-rich repeat protein